MKKLACITWCILLLFLIILWGYGCSSCSSAMQDSTEPLTKEQAIEIDKSFYNLVQQADKMTPVLQTVITQAGAGQQPTLDVYSALKQLDATLTNINLSFRKISDSAAAADYRRACGSFTISLVSATQDTLKYFDKGKIKYLNNAQNQLNYAAEHANTLVAKRTEFLQAHGVSEEEIAEITEALQAEQQ